MESSLPHQPAAHGAQHDGQHDGQAQLGAPARGSARPLGTILIADNEESNRILIEQILGLAGFRCLSVADGAAALRLLDRERVDLAILDVSMPVLDGVRATTLIRQRPGSARLPIVIVSGHALGAERDLAARSGCSAYLIKPFRPRELVRVVERLLRAS